VGALPWQERAALLDRAADLISERRNELAALQSLEVGKTRLEVLGDVEESADLIRYYTHPDDQLLTVHDAALVEFLRTAWEGWTSAGLPKDPGADRVVPYVLPHPGLLGELAPSVPAAT
jgi:Aldehyde dehydrogenase family